MAKKKRKKSTKKNTAQTKGAPSFDMKQSAPKFFGANANAWSGTSATSKRAPGSQRKR